MEAEKDGFKIYFYLVGVGAEVGRRVCTHTPRGQRATFQELVLFPSSLGFEAGLLLLLLLDHFPVSLSHLTV